MDEYCLYLRKSRIDLEAEANGQGDTLARHRAALLKLAQKRGFNITGCYEEVRSGESHRGPARDAAPAQRRGGW